MQRRDFLRNTAILGVVMATPSTVLGAEKAMGNKRVFDVTLNHAPYLDTYDTLHELPASLVVAFLYK